MAMEIDAFREDFIRDVRDIAEQSESHPTESFINMVVRRFGDELGMPTDIDFCYVDRQRQGKFKRMRLDAGAYDPTTFEGVLYLAVLSECLSQADPDALFSVPLTGKRC